VAEYREALEKARPAPNVVLLIGHNTIRAGVAGYQNRAVTPGELREMVRALEQALDEGGRGLSTGLIYAPGFSADAEEIVALAKGAARHGGVYSSHMRSEGAGLLDALDETLDVGRRSGARVQVSHLKAAGPKNWSRIDDAFSRIRNARDSGLDVCADRYPYTSSYTDLDVILPDWASDGGRDALIARLRDSASRERVRADLAASRPDEYWGTITVGSTSHPENRRFQGMALLEIAGELGLEPVDTVLHLVETDDLKTSAFFAGMSEENMYRVLAEPYVMLGSDASLRSPTGILGRDHPHPRTYGSFPRFLRMSLDGRTVPPAEAVRKMTSLPAEQFGLTDRGVLAEGRKADLVVFAPARVHDTATYGAPHRLATGIDHVIVNGVRTLSDGQFTGDRGGRFL
jgi:N-acyl-D-amino-acid deacylase